eukprot:TRINITY_DN12698_c0_g1_i6.p1 TRINITY_DN12698_c0_g1~~TRINITY_DN12698_c0_g1_i6.p1  ORF type:complete len:424 (+),score=158.39 TRINITY_DN12698_c0_g1_i6:452-1723(+)
MGRRGVSSNFHGKPRYPFYASEIFNSEASDIINMLFMAKPPKEPEKPLESIEDEQTGQKGAFTNASETLEEQEEKRGEEQKGEEVGVKDEDKEQAVGQESEPTAQLPQEIEVKGKEEEAKGEEQAAEDKGAEEKIIEDKPVEEKPVDNKTQEIKTEEAAEEKTEPKPEEAEAEHKPSEELSDVPDEPAKEVEGVGEKKEEYQAESKPPQPEDEDNVLQEDQLEEKDGVKSRYGLLEKLLSFLNTSEEVNPTLAGYFSKVMQIIIEKRKLDLLEYLFTYKEHAGNLIKHSYNKSISDILNKILSNEDKFVTGTTGEEFLADKQELLKAMIKKMEPENTGDDIINNCSILCTLIDGKQYLEYLLSEEVIEAIFKLSVSGNPMSLRAGLTLIIVAIRTKLNAENATTVDRFEFGSSSGNGWSFRRF